MTADPGYPAMADRKQEAVDALKEKFSEIWEAAQNSTKQKVEFASMAEKFYARIAPLMQERITWAVASRKDRTIITIRDDGEEVYSHSCPTRYIADLSNGVTCKKCGGSGWVPHSLPEVRISTGVLNQAISGEKTCPNCGGTGKERRSGGERRKGKDERRILGTFRQFVLEDTEEHYRLAGNHDNVAQIEQRLMTTWRRNIPDRRK